MKHIQQAGGIVHNLAGSILMVQALSKKWTFPKGQLLPGEELLAGARREIAEETGITELELIQKIGSYERPGFTKENLETPSVIKQITLFQFETTEQSINVNDDGTLDAAWVPFAEVADRLSHPADWEFFMKNRSGLLPPSS